MHTYNIYIQHYCAINTDEYLEYFTKTRMLLQVHTHTNNMYNLYIEQHCNKYSKYSSVFDSMSIRSQLN